MSTRWLATSVLVLATLGLPPVPAAAAGADDDWEAVREAQARWRRGDWKGALDAIAGVEKNSEAWESALLIKRSIELERAPHVGSSTHHFHDTQPLEWTEARLSASFMPSDAIELASRLSWLSVLGNSSLPNQAYGAELSARLDIAGGALPVSAHGGLTRWNDRSTVATGGLATEVRWFAPLFVRGQLRRDQVLVTPRAIARHVTIDAGAIAVQLRDWRGWSAEVYGGRHWWSDTNYCTASYAWLAADLFRAPSTVIVGWTGAYADTAANRWDAVTQRYDPYFTPLESWRLGPLIGTRLSLDPVTLQGQVEWSLDASEIDPNSDFWGVEVRRKWTHVDATFWLQVDLGNTALRLRHHYNHQQYYRYHETSVTLDVALR